MRVEQRLSEERPKPVDMLAAGLFGLDVGEGDEVRRSAARVAGGSSMGVLADLAWAVLGLDMGDEVRGRCGGLCMALAGLSWVQHPPPLHPPTPPPSHTPPRTPQALEPYALLTGLSLRELGELREDVATFVVSVALVSGRGHARTCPMYMYAPLLARLSLSRAH